MLSPIVVISACTRRKVANVYFRNRADQGGDGPSQIILAVESIDRAVAEMNAKGITVSGTPITAGTFLRFVTTLDPDGNTVAISEYLRDAIEPI